MRQCWKQAASERPSFDEIFQTLSSIISANERFDQILDRKRKASSLPAPLPLSLVSNGNGRVASTKF